MMREFARRVFIVIATISIAAMNTYVPHVAFGMTPGHGGGQSQQTQSHQSHAHGQGLGARSGEHATHQAAAPIAQCEYRPGGAHDGGTADYGCCNAACAPAAFIVVAASVQHPPAGGDYRFSTAAILHPAPTRALDPPPR